MGAGVGAQRAEAVPPCLERSVPDHPDDAEGSPSPGRRGVGSGRGPTGDVPVTAEVSSSPGRASRPAWPGRRPGWQTELSAPAARDRRDPAAAAIRGIRGSPEPHGRPAALASLELPTGALTAVLGLLLARGQFIPGSTARTTPCSSSRRRWCSDTAGSCSPGWWTSRRTPSWTGCGVHRPTTAPRRGGARRRRPHGGAPVPPARNAAPPPRGPRHG